ncbi:replication protein A 70 kDa DNA-binding subunit B [Tanacetum coccineum]
MRLRDPTLIVAHADEMIAFEFLHGLMSMGVAVLKSIALDDKDEINSHVLDSMSGDMHELFSADTICSTSDNLEEMQIMYPPEFLNTLSSHRAIMSIRYHYVGDLYPNLTDKWTVNVMVARRTSIHAKIPTSLINRFGNRVKEGSVYTTDILDLPSLHRPQLFDRLVFQVCTVQKPQVHQKRYSTSGYDVIGVLREWGPLQNNVESIQGCNPQVRKIVIADMSDIKLNISLWGKCALMYEDKIIESKKNTNIVVVLRPCCRVRSMQVGTPQLTDDWYKLVIQVRDHGEDIDCVLFNSDATQLLGITVEDLITKTLTEGEATSNWIVRGILDNR